jgi:hypothetical protein
VEEHGSGGEGEWGGVGGGGFNPLELSQDHSLTTAAVKQIFPCLFFH